MPTKEQAHRDNKASSKQRPVKTPSVLQASEKQNIPAHANVLQLQQTAGNRAVERLLNKSGEGQTAVERSIIQLDPDEEAIGRLWKIAQENPNGFTARTTGNFIPPEGFCAAYFNDGQLFRGMEGLKLVYKIAKTQDNIVGGWEHNGDLEFDSVKLFETEEMAIRFAYREHQIALYDHGERVAMNLNPLNPLWENPGP